LTCVKNRVATGIEVPLCVSIPRNPTSVGMCLVFSGTRVEEGYSCD